MVNREGKSFGDKVTGKTGRGRWRRGGGLRREWKQKSAAPGAGDMVEAVRGQPRPMAGFGHKYLGNQQKADFFRVTPFLRKCLCFNSRSPLLALQCQFTVCKALSHISNFISLLLTFVLHHWDISYLLPTQPLKLFCFVVDNQNFIVTYTQIPPIPC